MANDQNVAVFNDVLFAFQTQQALFLCSGMTVQKFALPTKLTLRSAENNGSWPAAFAEGTTKLPIILDIRD